MNMMLCGCIVEKKKADAAKSMLSAKKAGADLLELRMDQLEDPAQAGELIAGSPLPVIATFRRKKDGGRDIDEQERAQLLKNAISAGASYIDLELDMDEPLFDTLCIIAREKGCKVICSHHDFGKTPQDPELRTILGQLDSKGDISKLVTKAGSMDDCRRVLACLGKGSLIAFCMGKDARFTRIVSLLLGSPIAFCRTKSEAAVGQFSIKETKELLRRLG